MMPSRSVFLVLLVGACGTDSNNPPAAGGSADLDFAGVSGNVDTSPIAPTDIGVAFRDPESHTRVIGVFGFEPEQDGFRHKAWQLGMSLSGDPVEGGTYSIGSTATLQYEQGALGWRATTGTITVDSVSGTSATFSFSSVPMTAFENGATGAFTFTGTITVDAI